MTQHLLLSICNKTKKPTRKEDTLITFVIFVEPTFSNWKPTSKRITFSFETLPTFIEA